VLDVAALVSVRDGILKVAKSSWEKSKIEEDFALGICFELVVKVEECTNKNRSAEFKGFLYFYHITLSYLYIRNI